MKTFFITALFLGSIFSCTFSQKIEFSNSLANNGDVHSHISAVADRNGNIFVAGGTRDGLKVTDDAYQKSYSGHSNWAGGDIFLMKLSPEGELIYSTYIGDSGSEYYCEQITLDDFGNVYVGFTTDSEDLPVSENAYQKSHKGANDHYVIKFSNNCKYICSTYLGGSSRDHWTFLSVHNNVLYLIGCTNSQDFPITKGALQEEYNNWTSPDTTKQWMVQDISITALSLNLDKVLYSTYLGAKKRESTTAFCFDENGNILIAGQTWSDDYPVTKNGYDLSLNGIRDAFITVINPELSDIIYSTYIGGDSTEFSSSIITSDSNEIILTGETNSLDFPVTTDAISGKFMGGRDDAFLLKLNWNSSKLVYSSFIGGSGRDQSFIVEKIDNQKYVLHGATGSDDFPVTKDALDSSFNGEKDLAFLILDKTLKNIEYSTYFGGSKEDRFPNAKYINNGKLLISLQSKSSDFPITNKYAEVDSTHMNILLKIDLDNK